MTNKLVNHGSFLYISHIYPYWSGDITWSIFIIVFFSCWTFQINMIGGWYSRKSYRIYIYIYILKGVTLDKWNGCFVRVDWTWNLNNLVEKNVAKKAMPHEDKTAQLLSNQQSSHTQAFSLMKPHNLDHIISLPNIFRSGSNVECLKTSSLPGVPGCKNL